MQLLVIGPIGHHGEEMPPLADRAMMRYKGFRLIAQALQGPVGWVAELAILPVEGRCPVAGHVNASRFYADPATAVQEALLQGMRSVDAGIGLGWP